MTNTYENKLIIKGQDIPFKTGLYLLKDHTIIKITRCKSRFSVVVIDELKFDYPKVQVVDIIAEEFSVYCLGSDKYVYRMAFDNDPTFKRLDFKKNNYIPEKFNEALSDMYRLSNFKAERTQIFKPKTVKNKTNNDYSEQVLDLDNTLRTFYMEEYKTREN